MTKALRDAGVPAPANTCVVGAVPWGPGGATITHVHVNNTALAVRVLCNDTAAPACERPPAPRLLPAQPRPGLAAQARLLWFRKGCCWHWRRGPTIDSDQLCPAVSPPACPARSEAGAPGTQLPGDLLLEGVHGGGDGRQGGAAGARAVCGRPAPGQVALRLHHRQRHDVGAEAGVRHVVSQRRRLLLPDRRLQVLPDRRHRLPLRVQQEGGRHAVGVAPHRAVRRVPAGRGHGARRLPHPLPQELLGLPDGLHPAGLLHLQGLRRECAVRAGREVGEGGGSIVREARARRQPPCCTAAASTAAGTLPSGTPLPTVSLSSTHLQVPFNPASNIAIYSVPGYGGPYEVSALCKLGERQGDLGSTGAAPVCRCMGTAPAGGPAAVWSMHASQRRQGAAPKQDLEPSPPPAPSPSPLQTTTCAPACRPRAPAWPLWPRG